MAVGLTAEQVKSMLLLYDTGVSAPALAAQFGVSEMQVSRIIRGTVWKSVTHGRNRSVRDRTTAARRAYIEARFDQGCFNPATIGRELGISRQAVTKIIARYDIRKADRTC